MRFLFSLKDGSSFELPEEVFVHIHALRMERTELLEALEEVEVLVSTLTDPNAKVPHRADVAKELLPRIQKVIRKSKGSSNEHLPS